MRPTSSAVTALHDPSGRALTRPRAPRERLLRGDRIAGQQDLGGPPRPDHAGQERRLDHRRNADADLGQAQPGTRGRGAAGLSHRQLESPLPGTRRLIMHTVGKGASCTRLIASWRLAMNALAVPGALAQDLELHAPGGGPPRR